MRRHLAGAGRENIWVGIVVWALAGIGLFGLLGPTTPAALAEVIDPNVLATTVGRTTTTAAAATASATPDLCAPCLPGGGSLCFTGVCTDDANNSGNMVCSQFCQAGDNSCPPGFACLKPTDDVRTICVPDANTVCQQRYMGAATNTTCSVPAAVSGLSADLRRSCIDGDTCYVLPISSIGTCVHKCTRNDPDVQCDPGYTCCWAQNADGSCVTQPQAGVGAGGCLMLRQPGQSCVVGEQSVCVAGASCQSPTTDTALSVCYRSCAATSDCIASEKCVTFGRNSVCCDTAYFDGTNPSTCRPASGTCLRQVGVACDDKSDCVSGLCQKSTTLGGFCSQACTVNADCPAPQSDVNGDGVADGGSSCRQQPGGNLCIPNGAVATPPLCATNPNLEVGSQPSRTAPSGGCAQAGAPGALLLGLSCVWLWRRRAP